MFAFYGGESVYHRYILVLHLCNLFVFLWLVNFTIALGQCTLAGAFASYYWALKKPSDIPACPLYSSFSRAIRYGAAETVVIFYARFTAKLLFKFYLNFIFVQASVETI